MDQYSRKIKGFHASRYLNTEHTTIPALKMAMKHLHAGQKPIIHSDGGGQYYSKAFLRLTENRFSNSMGESGVWESSCGTTEQDHKEQLPEALSTKRLPALGKTISESCRDVQRWETSRRSSRTNTKGIWKNDVKPTSKNGQPYLGLYNHEHINH